MTERRPPDSPSEAGAVRDGRPVRGDGRRETTSMWEHRGLSCSSSAIPPGVGLLDLRSPPPLETSAPNGRRPPNASRDAQDGRRNSDATRGDGAGPHQFWGRLSGAVLCQPDRRQGALDLTHPLGGTHAHTNRAAPSRSRGGGSVIPRSWLTGTVPAPASRWGDTPKTGTASRTNAGSRLSRTT